MALIQYTPRTVYDDDVQFPFRYNLYDLDGNLIATYDIEASAEPGDFKGTDINKSWLQPIEDALGNIADDLNAFDTQIGSVDYNLAASGNAINARINTTGNRLDSLESSISLLAPINNPVLANPTANTVAITTNSTNLATTAAVKTYLDNLFSSYLG